MRSTAFTQLEDQVEKTKGHFHKVMDFVRQNRDVVQSIKHDWLAKVIQAESAKMKIRILYIDTINAAGGNNLKLTGESCEHLFNIVDRLDDRTQISLNEFYRLFGDDVISHHNLFNRLVESEDLINFGKKKAALFLRHLHIIHTRGKQESRFISDYNIGSDDLVIPVDIVIVTVLNKIWGTNLSPSRHFDDINKIAKQELRENFMLVEDLWFWGYFNTKVIDGRQAVDTDINKAKYYSANFIYPNEHLWNKLSDFSGLINSK
jgi:hypothetical protein